METLAHLKISARRMRDRLPLFALIATLAITPTHAIAQSYPGTLQNTATSTVPGGVTDPAPGNNSGTDINTLAAQSALTLTKTLLSPSPAAAGSQVHYRVEITNAGPSAAIGATVTDTLPPQLGAATWTCTASAGSLCSAASGSGNIALTLNLVVGGTVVIDVLGTAPTATPATIGANTATITPPPGTTDPNPGDNTATTPPVPVTPNAINAVDDTAGPIDGGPGQINVVNVLTNDTINGVPVTAAQIVLTPSNAGPLTIQADGSVNVAAATPTGVYTASYQICEAGNPTNCDTAAVTVTVNAAATIDAVNDTFAPQLAGSVAPLGNVLGNDTLGGGSPVGLVTLTANASGDLTIAADGTATLAAGAAPGIHSATYQICETAFPANCDSATATVRVFPPIIAVADTAGPINGTTGAPSVINVLDNDTAGGAQPPTLTVVTLTPANTPQVIINADGTVTIPPGTPAGTHTASYTLCYIDAPALCGSATVQIAVATPGTLIAADDTFNGIDGTAGNANAGNVRGNDTLNGGAATPALVSIDPVTSGPLTIAADGTVSVGANTPAGTYTATYTACEILVPDNCDDASVSVVVSSIAAQTDSLGPIPPGATAGNVLGNDFVNGIPPADNSEVTLTQLAGTPAIIIAADGTVTVAAATPAGPLTARYRICLIAFPAICSEADVNVAVAAGTIIALDDVLGPVNGSSGGTATTNVLTNDTLGGAPVIPAQVTLTPANAGPITIATDGSVSVAPGTPAGAYAAGYTLCENLNPSNCDSAQITVNVSTLDAVDDALGPINGAIGGSAGNVLTNDQLDGVPPSATAVILTPTNAGPITIGVDGNVFITPGTPAGSYTASYTICSQVEPSICDGASVSVDVVAIAALDAVADAFGPVDGTLGNPNAGNVLANDTRDGIAVVPGTVTLTPTVTAPLSIAADGTVSVAAGATAGVHTGTYQICEIAQPDNCDVASLTVTVVVEATIVANDDGPYQIDGVAGGTAPVGLLANDTYNGVAITPGLVTLTHTAPAPITVAQDGTLTVTANTAPNTYTFTYTLCEATAPANCDSATVTLVIATVIANDDAFNYAAGTAGAAGNVLTNDIHDGVAATTANVTLTGTFAAPLSMDANGDITVAPGTAAGTYSGTYTICSIAAPTVCDSGTVSVAVSVSTLIANDDTIGPADGTAGGTVGNVVSNDTLNGTQPNPGTDVTLTPNTSAPITIAPDGTVTLTPGTPSGTYTGGYTLCEVANPSNCDSATVAVAVTTLDAQDDNLGPANGTTGGTAGNVLTNDTLDGAAITGGVVLTPTTNGPISIASDGTVTIAAGTAAGNYTATYQICLVAQPTICDSATVSVAVTVDAVLDAVDDSFGPADGVAGAANLGNVLANDTSNGTPLVAGTITLTVTATAPLSIAPDGTVSLAPETAGGTYTAQYQICETASPANCDSATVTVTVDMPPIAANDDTAPPVPGGAPIEGVINVLSNDWYYDGTADPQEVILTSMDTNGALTLNPDGSVDVAAGTPGGTYWLTYQMCDEINPDNCDDATVTVVVAASALSATDDNAQTEQDTPVQINALSNDLYAGAAADPTRVQVGIVTPPTSGVAQPNDQGLVLYTPGQHYSGGDSFQYNVCERADPDNCVNAMVTVSVLANVVTLTPDQAIARGGPVTIDVLANDTTSHAPLVPATLTIAVPPQFGEVVCAQTSCTYTPQEDFVGQDGFTYRVCDASVPTPICAEAAVTVDVQAIPASLRLTKIAERRSAQIGDLVRYTLRIENVGEVDAEQVSLLDTLPAGFNFVAGSLQASDGDTTVALSSTQPLRVDAIDVAIGETATLSYVLRVGAGVGSGVHTNRAIMRDDEGTAISNEATADVEVAGDPLLDDSLIIGTVFNDSNGNGRQDDGERGLAGVRLGTVEGLIVETDQYGRFHLVGIDGGNAARGRNFLMKVDTTTLPPGSRFTTPNPRVLRITPGVPVRFDFGVQIPGMPLGGGRAEVTIELGQVAFAHDSAQVPPEQTAIFDRVAAKLKESGGGSVAITANAGDFVLAMRRASATRDELDKRLPDDVREATRIEMFTQVGDVTALVTFDKDIALGNLLFDTDSATIRPQYLPLLEELAKRIESGNDTLVAIIGHADARGSEDHNRRLSVQRAEAVAHALSGRLSPERRARLQVVPRPSTRVTGLGVR